MKKTDVSKLYMMYLQSRRLLEKQKVVNFDIIHNECRQYLTINKSDFEQYPKGKVKQNLSTLRKINKNDSLVDKNL